MAIKSQKLIFCNKFIVKIILLLSTISILQGYLLAESLGEFADAETLSTGELDKLTSPIALYPDTLLIQILQAASYPDQISDAAAWLRINDDQSKLQGQLWDPSVIAIAYHPSVVNMMYQQSKWTSDLGLAYVNQRADILNSIQRLRTQARSQGNLVTTPQQTVIVQGSSIQIVPTNSNIIYVPQYNPAVIYTQPAPSPANTLLAFGAGMAIGSSMNSSSVNWNTNTVVYNSYPSSYYKYGSAQSYAAAGPRGYGQGYTAQGTGAYGNQYNTAAVAGRTWNGGSYSGTATTNQWQNGAKTGSYSASGSGPNGSASARGWGAQYGDSSAGGFSRSATNGNAAVNVSGSGYKTADSQGGSITASGVNREGDYASKTWTGSDGNRSYSSRSGNLFSGAQSGSYASNYSSRGAESRFGGGGFSGGGFSRGGGGFRR